MAGMVAVHHDDGTYARRFRGSEPDGAFLRVQSRGRLIVPDLTDPATCGCLLAMLWEVYSLASVDVTEEGKGLASHGTWYTVSAWSLGPWAARSVGTALAFALLAALEKPA